MISVAGACTVLGAGDSGGPSTSHTVLLIQMLQVGDNSILCENIGHTYSSLGDYEKVLIYWIRDDFLLGFDPNLRRFSRFQRFSAISFTYFVFIHSTRPSATATMAPSNYCVDSRLGIPSRKGFCCLDPMDPPADGLASIMV